MKLDDMFRDSNGYYDPTDDEFTRRSISDTRKPALKLRDLNKLKKIRAMRKLERLKRQDLLSTMYGAGEEGGFGGGPSF